MHTFSYWPATPQAEEKKKIKRDSNFVGFLLIALLGGQLLIGLILGVAIQWGAINPLLDDYGLGHVGYHLLGMLEYMLYVAVPVLAVVLVMRRGVNPFPSRRVERGTYPVAFFGGLAMAVAANFIAGFVMDFLMGLGVPYPDFPDSYEPTLTSLLLNLISTAVFPALLEEMTMRGYILGALRPYGDRLAVTISAVVFGLIHGNVLQFPFAMILGMVLGWLTVKTNSIWPAVLLHFANNTMSVVLSWIDQFTRESDTPIVITYLIVCLTGTIVFLATFLQKKPYREDLLAPVGNGASPLQLSKRVQAIVTAPAFLVGGILWVLILILSLF